MAPEKAPRGGRPIVPLALGFSMAILIAISVVEGSSATSAALPAPSQYTTPSPQSPFADPLVIGGVVLVALVAAAFLFLLFFRRRGRTGGKPVSGEEEEEGGAGEGTEDDAGAAEGPEAEPTGTTVGGGTSSGGTAEGSSEWQEGSEPTDADLDSTLDELDELAKTSDETMPSTEKP